MRSKGTRSVPPAAPPAATNLSDIDAALLETARRAAALNTEKGFQIARDVLAEAMRLRGVAAAGADQADSPPVAAMGGEIVPPTMTEAAWLAAFGPMLKAGG